MPTWDEYFFNILEQVKTRSPDPRTQVACIFTKNNKILGTGYNALSSGLDIKDLNNENKYPWMIHAEENCVDNSKKKKNITAYITHLPCHRCMRLIWNYGVRIIKISENRRVFSYTDDDWMVLGGHIWLGLQLYIGDDYYHSSKLYKRLDVPLPRYQYKLEPTINNFKILGQELKNCLTITK